MLSHTAVFAITMYSNVSKFFCQGVKGRERVSTSSVSEGQCPSASKFSFYTRLDQSRLLGHMLTKR